MDPGPKAPKRPGPRAGPGPRESLLVCWAKAQGSVGRPPYIGVYKTDIHVGGHRPAASLRPLTPFFPHWPDTGGKGLIRTLLSP